MIDLHSHSRLSDGSLSPAELLAEAQHAGLTAIAITDHDTLSGFDCALPLASDYGLELVCGIELSTQFEHENGTRGMPLHLLGYFFLGPPNEEFRAWLKSIASSRRDRNIQLMDRLRSRNVDISWDDFPSLGPDIAARPHYAKVLIAKGYVTDFQTAFDRYLGDAVLAGIERKLPSTQEAIRRIIRNGGLASLAHPGRLSCHPSELGFIIAQLRHCGMGAIEVYHSDHSENDRDWLLQIAAQSNLLVTGGSDYHGDNKPYIRLGTGRNGNICLPDELLAKLKDQRVGQSPAITAQAHTKWLGSVC